MTQPELGLLMTDYDSSPDMPEALRCDSVEEVMDKLAEAVPELASVGYVGTNSSSSGVHCPETEKTYSGGGFHTYIAVQGVDPGAFKNALKIKLWNAGLGYIGFSKNGSMLIRTLVDLSVFSPERLIYEASPVLNDGLAQHPRKWSRKDGTIFVGNLTVTEDEINECKQRINKARQEPSTVEHSRQIAEKDIATKAPEYAETYKISLDEATNQLRAQRKRLEHGKLVFLGIDDMLYVDANKQLSGAELIEHGEQYDGRSIPDPIEGPKYGLSTAIFNNGRIPRIHSFAHGQETVYELLEFSRIEEEDVETKSSATSKYSAKPVKPRHSHPLEKYTLTGMSAEYEEELKDRIFVLREIALQGQATLLFASPNSGKTLLVIWLVIDGIVSGSINPDHVFYINADDSFSGLTQKLKITEEYGFNMLAPGHKGFRNDILMQTISDLIKGPEAKHTIIILDTLKKFMDLMKKSEARVFWIAIRNFVSKGGTVIALAHVNKNRNSEGKLVYAGTSDSVEDADCAYTLDTLEHTDSHKVVEFENLKNRGDVAQRVSYRYSVAEGETYDALLASVERVDPSQAEKLRATANLDEDEQLIITAITQCIYNGINTKMRIAKEVAKNPTVSRNKTIKILDANTGDDPCIHKWSFEIGDRGAKVFYLLETSES